MLAHLKMTNTSYGTGGNWSPSYRNLPADIENRCHSILALTLSVHLFHLDQVACQLEKTIPGRTQCEETFKDTFFEVDGEGTIKKKTLCH